MPDTRRDWESYIQRERAALDPILAKLGYTLEDEQPHLLGERHLTQAVTTASGRKLILLGRTRDGWHVVIKATSDPSGQRELEHERSCRRVLHEIDFAYELFTSPKELFFGRRGRFLISIQAFIEQESSFLARPLKEQFAYALGAFKAQEGAHATTYGHQRVIRRTFGSLRAADYSRIFGEFLDHLVATRPSDTRLHELMRRAAALLHENRQSIDQYGGFLTHTDFVPHNIRIKDGQIYLLDYSSLRFGNKYEGWARFVNFMALYNPSLASALMQYVRENRTSEESRSLQLMRVYRLGEIIWYYARNALVTEGDLQALTQTRVSFWTDMLEAVLDGKELDQSRIDTYVQVRDSLRTEDEKRRQRGLH